MLTLEQAITQNAEKIHIKKGNQFVPVKAVYTDEDGQYMVEFHNGETMDATAIHPVMIEERDSGRDKRMAVKVWGG